MAEVIADTGAVSWTTHLSAGVGPMEWELRYNRPAVDVTKFAAPVVFTTGIQNVYDWSATIRGVLAPAQIGSTGLVTSSAGSPYLTNVKAWSINATCPAIETTKFAVTAPVSRTFVAGLISWDGTYLVSVDGTTALVAPGGTYTMLFRYFDAATDHTLAGDIYTTNMGPRAKVGELVEATYTFKGTGALTAAGSGTLTAPVFTAGALTIPAATTLTLTAATGRTYSGSAFWTRITVNCPVADLVTIEMEANGTGDLTFA